MIDLFYITNNVIEAQIVDGLDIDWIFIDLEKKGKKERQVGRDTVLSNHSITDVDIIKPKINNTKILVRCNPIGKWSENEFDQINSRGSKIDMVMLPYFKSIDEVKVFVDLLDVRSIEPSLLIETLDSINNLDNIIKIFPFKYVHLGLNDLHIERSTHLIFEPYIDGLIDYVTGILRKNDQNFGIGGIGKIGWDVSPTPECLINEHIRLQSSGVILSRSFKGNFNEKRKSLFKKQLNQSIKDFRNYEKEARNLSNRKLLESYKLMETDIEETIRNASV